MKISENKPIRIQLRLTQKQYDYIEKKSKIMDMSTAELVRLYIDYLIIHDYENNSNTL